MLRWRLKIRVISGILNPDQCHYPSVITTFSVLFEKEETIKNSGIRPQLDYVRHR